MSCEAVARVLLLDDDTVRTWHRLYLEGGVEGLAGFGYEGGLWKRRASVFIRHPLGEALRNARFGVVPGLFRNPVGNSVPLSE